PLADVGEHLQIVLGGAGAVVAGVVGGDPVAHLADQLADGQTGDLAGDVPEAVVEVAEPAGRLVDPARAEVEALVDLLAPERVRGDSTAGACTRRVSSTANSWTDGRPRLTADEPPHRGEQSAPVARTRRDGPDLRAAARRPDAGADRLRLQGALHPHLRRDV